MVFVPVWNHSGRSITRNDLERITHTEVEGESVPVEPLFRSHPFVESSRIVNLHTHVKSEKEESEIESESESPVGGNAFTAVVCAKGAV